MMMRIFRSMIMMFFCITLLFMASLTVRPSMTYACSCVATPVEPLESLEMSSAVFVGKVVAIKEPKGKIISSADYTKVTFEVDSSWKGVKSDKISLFTEMSSASCGYMFTEGENYLVYAGKMMDSGKLGVSMCSGTNLLSLAEEDLKELGPATPMSATDRGPITLVNVGISGVIVVLIAIIVAVLYRRKK